MAMTIMQEVQTFYSDTGNNRIQILKRNDGTYTWCHQSYLPPVPEYDWSEDWDVERVTGGSIFESYESALREAKEMVSWFRPHDKPSAEDTPSS